MEGSIYSLMKVLSRNVRAVWWLDASAVELHAGEKFVGEGKKMEALCSSKTLASGRQYEWGLVVLKWKL